MNIKEDHLNCCAIFNKIMFLSGFDDFLTFLIKVLIKFPIFASFTERTISYCFGVGLDITIDLKAA